MQKKYWAARAKKICKLDMKIILFMSDLHILVFKKLSYIKMQKLFFPDSFT